MLEICSMANVGVEKWVYGLAFFMILLRTEGFFVDITYVQSAVAKGAGELSTETWIYLFIYIFYSS